MKELVFLLEEESAKAMLQGLLPRVLDPRVQPRLMVFEGKQDLERQMVKRLRGKFGDDSKQPRIFGTSHGEGYVFTAPLS